MVALFRFLQHREVLVQFLPGFERGAVNALKLRICFVAFVVRARDGGQLECADVSSAHHVRTGAKIDKIAVAIERNFLVCRNILDDIQLKFAWRGTFAQCRQTALCAERQRFIPRNFAPFERMIRFDFVFHLSLDLFKIVGRDAVGKIHIVVKAVLHRRARSELCFRPDFEDSSCQNM